MSSYPYSNFDTGGETDILNVTGIDNNILVKDGNGAITSTFLTNNEVRGSVDFAEHINIVGLGSTAGYATSLQIENDSVRIGKNPSISPGTSNVAIGNDAQAGGNFSVGIGYETRANSSTSTAVGKSCVASGNVSVAIGTSCTASGSLSSAVGNTSTASGVNSFALGTGATAAGTRSLSVGNATNESGTTDSIAIGSLSTNLTNISNAISIGKSASCKTLNGIAIGNTALVNTNSSDGIAIGRVSIAQSVNAIAIGLNNNTAADNGICLGGSNTINTGSYDSIIIGVLSVINASCFRSIVMGYNSLVTATNSICIGENAQANSSGTICIGKSASIATSSTNSMAIGTSADATGTGSIALGYIARANSDNAYALGTSSTATGTNSTAIGGSSSSTQQFSTAIGYGATADAEFSVAIGQGDVGTGANRGIAIGVGADVNHADTIVISTNSSLTTSTRSGLFIDPVSEKTPDTNYSNVHYDTSTKEMYRSQYQLGLLLNRDINNDTTLTDDDLNGRVIIITATTGITITLPQCFDGANCVIINGSNHNHTLAKLSGNTLNYNATTLSLQTSKRVHHVYGVSRSGGGVTSRDWYVD